MNHSGHKWQPVCVATLLIAGFLPPLTADNRVLDEYEAKAAMILNIARFVDWPEWKMKDPRARFFVGLLGPTDGVSRMEVLITEKRIGTRTVAVRRLKTVAEAVDCDLLFFLDRGPDADQIGALAKAAVLTVGDGEHFALRGGIIGLVVRERRMQMEVNVRAAQRAGLTVSSRILQLATVVEERVRL